MMFRPITEGRKEASGRALERGDIHADQRDCNTYSAQVDGCFLCLFFVFFGFFVSFGFFRIFLCSFFGLFLQ